MLAAAAVGPGFDLFCRPRATQIRIEVSLTNINKMRIKFQAVAACMSICRCLFYNTFLSFFLFCLFSLASLPHIQKQHCCICGVCLQSQCHITGFQWALQVPGELSLCLATLPQPQPRLSGK